MKVALYGRVSMKGRDQDPEVQMVKLREFASRHGYDIHDEYVDFGTGRNANRPELKRMEADAKAGKLDAIIIVRLDRIMRSLVNLHALLESFKAWDVRLIVTDQSFDTSTASGRLMLNLLSCLAEWETELTSDRVKDGLEKARKEGKRIGRPPNAFDIELASTLLREGKSKAEIARLMKVPRTTLNRRLGAIR